MATAEETLAAFSALPSGLAAVVELGVDGVTEVGKLPRDSLGVIASKSRDELARFSIADLGPPPAGKEIRHIGLARVAIVLATHYQAAMKELVLLNDEHLSVSLAHPDLLDALTEVASSVNQATEAPDPLLLSRATIAAATRSLLGCWTLAAMLRYAPRNTPASDLLEFAQAAMEASVLLFEIPELLDEETVLVSHLCDRIASPTAAGVIDSMHVDRPRADLARITFAALRLDDVRRLSRRDSALRDIYDMPIARAFERQLSLLFMSFGFAVIESTPGRRYVDLLCIADTPEAGTVLVEAKSTAASEYRFPAADQRALVEHVTGVSRTLRGLPRLRLILIVAPRFSSGAAHRIDDVSREVGVACHGIPADLLIELRNNYLGPLPLDVLIEEICKGSPVVDRATVERILRITSSATEAWTKFVSVQRSARDAR
ncbi:MAG TPA: hypothetical protein VHU86_06710 [Solirubrobacterales bacterium]|jgi:hypothetical protein|nr:hypothetical protein [Solirubrobacterales bacterium]